MGFLRVTSCWIVAVAWSTMQVALAQPTTPLPGAEPTTRSAPQTAMEDDPRVAAALDASLDVQRVAHRVARDGVPTVGSTDAEPSKPAPDMLAARLDQRDPKCDLVAITVATAALVACSASDRCVQDARPLPRTGCRLGRLAR